MPADRQETSAPAPPPPRANTLLVGHDRIAAALKRLVDEDRLPAAIVLTGADGIGKATLAFRLARYLLAPADARTDTADNEAPLAIAPGTPTIRRVASAGHADLLTVERETPPQGQRARSDITIDAARRIAPFLRKTAGEGGWRVSIVDGAGSMNRNAQNAVLKVLEEPPQRALLILVAQSPGSLLPTIRSRCQKYPLSPLDGATLEQLLGRYCPDVDDVERARLLALSHGSIGRALLLREEGGPALYDRILTILFADRAEAGDATFELAEALAAPGRETGYLLVRQMLDGLLRHVVRQAATGAEPIDDAPSDSERVRALATASTLDRWLEVWENVSHRFEETDHANLDRRHAIRGAIGTIRGCVHGR